MFFNGLSFIKCMVEVVNGADVVILIKSNSLAGLIDILIKLKMRNSLKLLCIDNQTAFCFVIVYLIRSTSLNFL